MIFQAVSITDLLGQSRPRLAGGGGWASIRQNRAVRFHYIRLTFLGIVFGADHDAAHGKRDAGGR